MRIAIVGAGYVGLAVCGFFALRGHEIQCVEKDGEKIKLLRSGMLPIVEDGLQELLEEGSERICYSQTGNYAAADVVFICVGTPEGKDGAADLSGVYTAVSEIIPQMKEGCLIVLKSTVAAGTCDELSRYIHLRAGFKSFELCCVPEFLSQGRAVNDVLHPDRVVIGAETVRAREILSELYEGCNLHFMRRREAELVKLAANAFLALRISFVNELGNLCEAVGADCAKVSAAVGADTRIGNRYFSTGAGYGGSCLPKDTAALLHLAREKKCEFQTVAAAAAVNEQQKQRPLQKARRYYRIFTDLKAAVLGVSFKPGTDDIRNAPALETIEELLLEGARVSVWDGAALPRLKNLRVQRCIDIREAIQGADVCFIFTDWAQIKEFDTFEYARLMRVPLIIDGRNCYNKEVFLDTGITYECFGVGR